MESFIRQGNGASAVRVFVSVGIFVAVCSHNLRAQAAGWSVIETANFRVWSPMERQHAAALAERCETLRRELSQKWLAQRVSPNWLPKAEVVVHRTLGEYSAALNISGSESSGCSTIQLDQGRVTYRRIDLRADAVEWSTSTLPHELTHLVIADRFSVRQLPRWVDEGLAVLAESPAKRSQRRQAAAAAKRNQGSLALSDIVLGNPNPRNCLAFYVESAALVEFLVHRRGPEDFLKFVEKAMDNGYDQALREVYQLDGLRGLHDAWNRSGSVASCR